MTSSKVCEKKVCEIKMSQNPPIHTTIMKRVNGMSDTPAPAISTEAIYKTADRFEKVRWPVRDTPSHH